MATGVEAKSETRHMPFYRDPQNIGKALDIITPRRTLRVLESLFHYEEEKGFDRHVLHYLERDYWLVGVLSHLVLADAFALGKLAKRLTTLSQAVEDPIKHLTGCYALHQGTMEDGSQGANVKTLTQRLEPAFNRQGMFYLATISREHTERYHLDSAEVKKINAESTKKLESAPNERKALLLFPAGSMEAARLDATGKRKGMQQSNLMWIYQMAAATIYRKAKILFLPGVIVDSPRISGPDKRDLTSEAYGAFVRNLGADLLPFGMGRPLQAELARVTMRLPYSSDRLALDLAKLTDRKIERGDLSTLAMVMNSNKELTDRLIMGIIYDKMPPELRGDYYEGYNSFGLGDYAEKLY